MKKYFILLSLCIIALSSCQKVSVASQASSQAAIDDAKIQAYIKANNITVTKDPAGFYYQIISQGTAPNPTIFSNVKLTYSEQYLSGLFVVHADGVTLGLSTYPKAIQLAIPRIGTGGRIAVIMPSALGFGNIDEYGVPANSVLYYIIDLNGFY